jgi:hypothetical protein
MPGSTMSDFSVPDLSVDWSDLWAVDLELKPQRKHWSVLQSAKPIILPLIILLHPESRMM